MIGYDKVVLDDDVLKNNIKLAVLAASEKKFDEAFELLHVALKQAQSKKSESAENYVIDMMANLYYSKGTTNNLYTVCKKHFYTQYINKKNEMYYF